MNNDNLSKKILLITLFIIILCKDYNITDIKILLSVLISTLIVNFYINDIINSFIISVLIISIMYFINKIDNKKKSIVYENFDSLQKIKKDYKKENKDSDELSKDSIKLINLDPASDSEDEDKEKKLNENKKIEDYGPADAQKETYRMIDTVKQLKTTVESLAPTIKEGRKILEAFKKLDLNINDMK